MGSSVADSLEIGDWIDDNSSEALFPTLDDVLKDVENFDDRMSFLEESDATSLLGSSGSSSSSSHLHYQMDPGVSCLRLDTQSHQLASLANKCGSPTCVCESNGMVAVGGSRGMVLLFNSQGRLETFFAGDAERGSVGCLAFSPDGRYLAAGYGRGVVQVYHTKRRTLLHKLGDAVQPGTGVLQIAFLDSNHDFLTLDTAGNVFEIRMRGSLMGKLSHSIRCVFSGCNGEVVHMRTMPSKLIVLLTVTKVLLVTTQKGGAVLCAFPVSTFHPHPPLFDYNITTLGKRQYLRICLGRGAKLNIYVLYPDKFGTGQKVAGLLKSIPLPFDAVAMSWINPNGLLIFDRSGNSVFVNAEKGSVVRGLHKDLPIIFSTSTFKAHESGGNISGAMSSLAELVCYQSVCRTGDSLDVLTHEGLFHVRTNNEVDQLVKYEQRGDCISPCLFLLDLLKGRVKALACSREKLRELLQDALHKLVDSIVDTVNGVEETDLPADYRKLVQTLLHVCIESSLHSVLFDYTWPQIERHPLLRTICLESLDEYVLDGELESAPPSLVSSYLNYLANESHFSQLQAAVCRFPIHSIDIHMVMTVCRQNNLYDGVIHIMNKALLEYIGPLEEMLETVSNFAANDVISDSQLEQGNRLLLYIQCCLAGHGYPLGELPLNMKERVPLDVFRCVTSLHGKDGTSSSLQYPNLRTLLLFDAQQFFHVISTCMDSPLFLSSEGRLQRLIDILGEISDSIAEVDVLVQYFLMIIRLLESSRILASAELLERCICTLLRTPEVSELAEMTIIELMEAVPQLDREVLLRLSTHPLRSRICSFIYFSQRKFIEILKSIMSGDSKNMQFIFPAVQKILVADLTQTEMGQLSSFLKSSLQELGTIDRTQTAQLLLDSFPHFFVDLNHAGGKSHFFSVIQASFDIRRERQETFLIGDDEVDEGLFDIYFEGLVNECKWSDSELKETLVYWLPMGSRNDFCLNIAMPAEKFLTTIQLLEARGFSQRAFDLIFGRISKASAEYDLVICIDELLNLVTRHASEANENNWLIRSFREVARHCKSTSDGEMDSRLVTLIRRIMSGGSQHAFEVFSCLLDCQSFRDGDLTGTRSVIAGMLSSCGYEKLLLTSIAKTMEHENSLLLHDFQSQTSRRTTRLTTPGCYVCKRDMSKGSYAFGCGHMVHLDCDSGSRTCPCSLSYRTKGAHDSVHLLRSRSPEHKRAVFAKWNEELRLVP